jgi:cell division protein FtsQ
MKLKINYKKILVTVLWIIAISGLMTSLAFVSKKETVVRSGKVNITINATGENEFIDEDDVKVFFAERSDALNNTELKNININALEKALNTHPAVENADLSVAVNGDIKIEVKQRTPLVRVFNMSGESYYIDTQSKLMPLSDKYTARVLVVNGNIFEPYSRRYQFSVKEIADNKTFKEVSMLDDIYQMAEYISHDTLLSGLIHQLSINADKEFEMYPAIGDHKIIFGEAVDIADKFEKLKVFYKEGLNKTDNWNKYAIVNLKYKNQVVCTKK